MLEREQRADLIRVPLEHRLVHLRRLRGLLEIIEQDLRTPE